MTIRQLSLTDFRNLESSTLNFNSELNVITGCNGSGKTSLLESLYIICQGKSFKSNQLDACIQHNKNGFLLFSRFNKYKAGLSRNQKKTSIHIDNQNIPRLSLLAKRTPVRIINSSCFDLVSGKPSNKRDFIDWSLFHVEHDFQDKWQIYSHALKQKNSLLKKKTDLKQIGYWNVLLNEYNHSIYKLRKKHIEKINHSLQNDLSSLIDDINIKLVYEPGWDTSKTLLEVFKINRQKELKYGFTQHGIHRDNIKIFTNEYLVQNELSRGELKRLSLTLYIAQILLLYQFEDKKIILLIDDIQSELDSLSLQKFFKFLKGLDLQIFITAIDMDLTLLSSYQEYKMFHVEHGMIKAIKNT